MQIGKEDLTFAHLGIFDGDGLLDLHDHFRALPDLIGGRNNLRASGNIIGIANCRTNASSAFDQHGVLTTKSMCPRGSKCYAGFIIFNLFRNTNNHGLDVTPTRAAIIRILRRRSWDEGLLSSG